MLMRCAPLVVAALFATGCPKKLPSPAMQPPPDAWLVVHPSVPALCIPWLGEPDSASLATWHEAVAQLQARQLEPLQQAAEARAGAEGVHPSMRAFDGLLGLLGGDPQGSAVALDGLLAAHKDSPCLLAASATAQEMLGDTEEASKRIVVARSMAPDDPEIALMFAYMAPVDQASVAMEALEAGATEHPDRLGFHIALGVAAITRGDAEGAVTWLEHAVAGGDEKVAPMLLTAYRAAERTDDYLRLAAQMPLPVPSELAGSEQPMADLYEQWGVPEGDELTVTLHTSLGDATCTLFPQVAPITVASFMGLATGSQPWLTPEGLPGEGPLYRDLIFHRTIPDFMVQTGDPEGTGKGGPGYRFPDELSPEVGFDRAGRLAMANSGPNSNGSQFFITEEPTPHLDGRHTIFGQCDEASVGLVGRIARYPSEVALRRISVVGAERGQEEGE
jgi:peptidyl-prolyl cis-trans isomerase A (cyclophilin A)